LAWQVASQVPVQQEGRLKQIAVTQGSQAELSAAPVTHGLCAHVGGVTGGCTQHAGLDVQISVTQASQPQGSAAPVTHLLCAQAVVTGYSQRVSNWQSEPVEHGSFRPLVISDVG